MYYLTFILYNGVFVPLFHVAVYIAALFDRKIRRGLQGRSRIFENLQALTVDIPADAVRIWIHVSSMGEFEQVKPVIRSLKEKMAACKIILSFFSPSGFDHAGKYAFADVVTYLPADTYCGARKFISMIRPNVALVVRHDIWPNMQWRLYRLGIPSLLINASMPPQRLTRITRLRPFLRAVYRTFSEIYVTSEENAGFFRILYPFPQRIKVMGDTRYDQVCRRARETEKIRFLIDSGKFQRRHCLIAGSTWPADERVVLNAVIRMISYYEGFHLIIAPHEPTAEHVTAICDFFTAAHVTVLRLSQFVGHHEPFRALVIDRVGLLANLYALGALAYVGGGFGAGVHSVLEPAAHGTAVMFGPRHGNSIEAVNLVRSGGGRCVRHADDVYAELEGMMKNPQTTAEQGKKAQGFVAANVGATERTVAAVAEYLNSQGRTMHE